MTYNPNEIYPPAGRTLTEDEYNAVLADAPWNKANEEREELRHKLNLKELAIDSVCFYLRYQADDLRIMAENSDDDDNTKKLIMIALEAERLIAKLTGDTKLENRICERIDRGRWFRIDGYMRRILTNDLVYFNTSRDGDSYNVPSTIEGFDDDDMIVSYCMGDSDETAKEYTERVEACEITKVVLL